LASPPIILSPPRSPLFPYTTLFRSVSWDNPGADNWVEARKAVFVIGSRLKSGMGSDEAVPFSARSAAERFVAEHGGRIVGFAEVDRKSTRLNSSHVSISYAVFCLKK